MYYFVTLSCNFRLDYFYWAPSTIYPMSLSPLQPKPLQTGSNILFFYCDHADIVHVKLIINKVLISKFYSLIYYYHYYICTRCLNWYIKCLNQSDNAAYKANDYNCTYGVVKRKHCNSKTYCFTQGEYYHINVYNPHIKISKWYNFSSRT